VNPTTAPPSTATEALPPLADGIVITSIQVGGVTEAEVRVEGTTTLPTSTCIRTTLMVEGEAVAWWPGDACADRDGQRWALAAPLPEDGLDPTATYTFEAESVSDPVVTAQPFPFDVAPPPEP
jgi:hypothetical protein